MLDKHLIIMVLGTNLNLKNIMNYVALYWWVLIPLLSLVFYRTILRIIFGMVIIPEDRIGLVTKKFVLYGADKELPDGRIIATKGEAGYQPRLWLRACIGLCFRGNMELRCNPLPLSRKVK